MAIRERLDSLSRGELAGLVVVLAATLAGVGLWYSRSLPKPIQVAETPAPLFAAARDAEGAQRALAGREVLKQIVRAPKLVNFVTAG